MEDLTTYQWILDVLPYKEPFRFVDGLEKVDDNGVKGHYVFRSDNAVYEGHFKNRPVTPGVLLTECCAQIGLVCLGIALLGKKHVTDTLIIGMSSMQMDFLKPVFPGEQVTVVSNKVYFRFGKLKCKVKMYNEAEVLVCQGALSGMIKNDISHE
jgi:3-hydroxyacyl-[acyl-carrier-protein] dehydratase